MRLRIFQSGKGDCLLLTGADGSRVLVDGGVRASFRDHVAPFLDRMRKRGRALDVAYVSHIDADHIEGVLELFDNLVDWIVHDHQVESGNDAHPAPKSRRPPRPGEVWHNAFHEQLGKNAGPIADMYAAVALLLQATGNEELWETAAERHDLATSERQAILLSRRVGADQLDVPLNPPTQGKLMFAREDGQPFQVGGMKFTILGPFEEDLKRLRKEWNAWLRENRETLSKIRNTSARDEERLASWALAMDTMMLQFAAEELGNREKVTVPNLASLMFLVDEGSKTLLLTGDGHQDDIVKGLGAAGRLPREGGLHVNVLKVQHHGSENNYDAEFARRITADHYVLCGNGAHRNPDERVVELILRSRLGTGRQVSPNAEAGRRFKMWFSSSPDVPGKAEDREHMRKVRDLVMGFQSSSGGRLRAHFLDKSSVEFRV